MKELMYTCKCFIGRLGGIVRQNYKCPFCGDEEE